MNGRLTVRRLIRAGRLPLALAVLVWLALNWSEEP